MNLTILHWPLAVFLGVSALRHATLAAFGPYDWVNVYHLVFTFLCAWAADHYWQRRNEWLETP